MPTAVATFELGHVVATLALVYELNERHNGDENFTNLMIFALLEKHRHCEWGDLCAEDKKANEYALKNGERILSRYNMENGPSVYIITEWDRSLTTVMRVEDY
jgi:hypothetical protein